MKKVLNTITSLFMCLLMISGNLVTFSANAESEGYRKGDIIKFGKYEQDNNTDNGAEPIEWIVLDPSTGLCVSKYVLDAKRFDDNSNDYKDSEIRAWLYGENGNGEFYANAFSKTEKTAIKTKDVVTYRYGSDTDITSTVMDKVFLLSYQEENTCFANVCSTICSPTDYAVGNGALVSEGVACWWLRTAHNKSLYACGVIFDGNDTDYISIDYNFIGVRPAVYLDFDSEFFKTKITSDMISEIEPRIYFGYQIRPEITVNDGAKALIEGKDYTVKYSNNIDAGTATAKITGIGNYAGEVTTSFTINKRKVVLTSASDSKTYDGTPLSNRGITISGDGFAGEEGAVFEFTNSQTIAGSTENFFDYELNPNTKASNYDITTVYGVLTVKPKELTSSMISALDDATYTSSPIMSEVTVKDGKTILTANNDYTVSYSDNINAGIASVTVKGINNYSGVVYETFNIFKAEQKAPNGIIKTDETKCSENDGTISGLTTAMEIAYERGEFKPCKSTELTGLTPGTYSIRYSEAKNYTASQSVQIIINKGECYGGTATCRVKAICDGCKKEYGTLGEHEWNDSYTVDKEATYTEAGSESIHCKHCDATKETRSIISISEKFEIEKSNAVAFLNELCKEHDSRYSQIIINKAVEDINGYVYDKSISFENNVEKINAIKEEANEKVNERHNFIYGCPFLCFFANLLEPVFACINEFVIPFENSFLNEITENIIDFLGNIIG